MKEYLAPHLGQAPPRQVSWMDETPLWSAPFGLKLLEIIPLRHDSTVLDLGFGFGFPLIELALRMGASSNIVGIDPWELAHSKARAKINILQLKNVWTVRAVGEKLPFASSTFDLITSNNGINNVSDIPATLHECSRVLKSGATFVFTMNTEYTMHEFYNVFKAVLAEKGMSHLVDAVRAHIHEKRRPESQMRAWLVESGLPVIRSIHDSFVFRYADGTAMLNHTFIRDGFLPAWAKLVPQNRLEAVFDAVENRLNEISSLQGELRLTVPFLTCVCLKS